MTLQGLPEVATGSIVISAVFSVLVSTAGLTLLRGTRPSEVERLQHGLADGSSTIHWLLLTFLGVFGALLYFIGLVLSSVPMLMGVSTDDEGKAAAVVQCTLVLLCWTAERYLITGHTPPALQNGVTAAVWFGSTIIQWAAPRPHDNISLGMRGQIAGCDGGYRSPFMIYTALWVTSLLFGSILLLFEQGTSLLRCAEHHFHEDDEAVLDRASGKDKMPVPHAFRRKILPILYGFATSMSGILFATGAARNDMVWVFAGAMLLVLAVVCAWDWLWRLELTLSSWAPLSHGFSTLLHVGQGHLVFRDFRWDPDNVYGFLVVWRWPGLPLFLFGMLLIIGTSLLYVQTSDWSAWGEGTGDQSCSVGKSSFRWPWDHKCRGGKYTWQWLLLPICMTCLIIGISMPLIETEMTMPDVAWLKDEDSIQQFKNSTAPGEGYRMKRGKSYLDLISWLYDRRLPCSALVIAYNSCIMPPLQFLCLLTVLLQPDFVPEEMLHHLRGYLMNQAPFRFTNPMVLMLMVGFLNLSGPAGAQFEANFTRGYWYFLTYCMTSVLLAWSVQATEEDVDNFRPHAPPECFACEALACAADSPMSTVDSDGDRRSANGFLHKGHPLLLASERKGDSRRLLSKNRRTRLAVLEAAHDDGDDDEDDPEDGNRSEVSSVGDSSGCISKDCKKTLEIVGLATLAFVMPVVMYLALTQKYLSFEYRLSGVVLEKMEPSILDLWRSLASVNRPLSIFAGLTLVFMLFFWLTCLAARILNEPEGKRPTGGVHKWAKRLEQASRPWVMAHIWAFSFMLVYYIVTARNKAVVEVCAAFPQQPIGFVSIACMGAGVLALVKLAQEMTHHPHHSHGSKMPGLPGSKYVWGAGAFATAVLCIVVLFRTGPVALPEIATLEDVNDAFSRLIPAANKKLHTKLPESAGDCQALWNHRVLVGKALYASPESEIHRHCVGSGPLARMSSSNGRTETEVTAVWATGLNTLEVDHGIIRPPFNVSTDSQLWNMTLNGKFTDLHIWLRVMIGDEEWVNDYMCCNNPFHFTLEVSATCERRRGFEPMHIRVIHIDQIEFVHSMQYMGGPGSSATLDVDYGRSAIVEQALENFMAFKSGKMLVKNKDGSTTDPLVKASSVLEDVVFLNSGHRCVDHI